MLAKVSLRLPNANILFGDAVYLTRIKLQVGAGIQISPNAGRLLTRWRVMDELAGQAI